MERMLKAVLCIIVTSILAGCGKVEPIPGPAGKDGAGCTVQSVSVSAVAPNGGALIVCATSQTLILNGRDGADAQLSAYAIVGIVNPCGNQSSQDEVFLRLSNGRLLASFSDDKNGKNTRLTELFDGSGYVTTDGTNCVFSLSTSNGSRTISWSGGSQSWTVN